MGKIRAPPRKLHGDSEKFTENWNTLSSAILEIYKKNASNLSFEVLYRNAYDLVLAKQGERLYDSVEALIKTQMLESRVPVLSKYTLDNCTRFLLSVKQIWDHSLNSLKMIIDILMYVQRSFVEYSTRKSFMELGIDLFTEHFANSIKDSIVKSLILLINAERNQAQVNRDLVRATILMLQTLKNVYETDFLPEFLKNTTEFYDSEAEKHLKASSSTNEYLAHVQRRIGKEEENCNYYLAPLKTIRQLEIVFLDKRLNGLNELPMNLVWMIEFNEFNQLKRAFKLLKRAEKGSLLLKNSINEFISSQSIDFPDSISLVKSILELIEKTYHMLHECFANERDFLNQINTSLSNLIEKVDKMPDFLSGYIDFLMKNCKKTEELIEKELNLCFYLFKFLKEKDVFEGYYKQFLAKRLMSSSINEDLERTWLVKLKLECGTRFTFKMESMFNDVKLSNELEMEFRQKTLKPMRVHVLTMHSWPLELCNQPVPLVFQEMTSAFDEFYKQKYTGRKLNWLLNMGSADVKCNFDNGIKEFNMSTNALLVLLTCFNDFTSDSLGFNEIMEKTGIPVAELKKTLHSLSLFKWNLLVKSTDSKSINQTDEFTFNSQFSSPISKIKIPLVNAKTAELKSTTLERIQQDRTHLIEACIVRLLKAKQTIEHNQLVSSVIQQLSQRFVPDPLVIKRRIESLIEREYMERDESNLKLYRYVA